MAPVGYKPMPIPQTPQQQQAQQLSLMQYLQQQQRGPAANLGQFNSGPQPVLTYEQWVAQGAPPQMAPTQQPDYSQFLSQPPIQPNQSVLPSVTGAAAVGGAAAMGGTTFSSGVTVAGEPLMQMADGSILMSSGATVPASAGTPIASAAAGGGAAGGAFDIAGIGAEGNAFLPLIGVAGGADVLMNDRGPVRGGIQGAASGAAIGSYFGPEGALIGGGIGGAAGLAKGLLKHETTRDFAKKNTDKLLSAFPDDATYQAYVRGMREQYNSAPPDPSKPFHGGQYGSWDEYQRAGLDAADLTGVKGNIETFGPEWSKLNFDQQKAVTQGIINANLYNSNRGEVGISDQARAKQIFDEVSKGGFKSPTTTASTATTATAPIARDPSGTKGSQINLNTNGIAPTKIALQSAKTMPPPIMIPRSKTRSPGIGNDGRPIYYGGR